jgi:hypothetical protein
MYTLNMSANPSEKDKAASYDLILNILESEIVRWHSERNSTLEHKRREARAALDVARGIARATYDERLTKLADDAWEDVGESLRKKPDTSALEAAPLKRFRVYYARLLPENPFYTPNTFVADDYVDMGELEAQDIEHVYGLLNDPEDEAFRAKCLELMIHTAMSAGDVLQDEEGRLWMCENQGWKELPVP